MMMDSLTRKRKRPSLTSKSSRNKRVRSNSLSKWQVTLHSGCRKEEVDGRDLIRRLDSRSMHGVLSTIFGYLDYDSLVAAENVSFEWRTILSDELIWKRLLERNMAADVTWRKLHDYLMRSRAPTVTVGLQIQRQTCKEIAELHRLFVALMSSSVKLLTSSVGLISKVIDLVRLFGFAQSSSDSDSDEY